MKFCWPTSDHSLLFTAKPVQGTRVVLRAQAAQGVQALQLRSTVEWTVLGNATILKALCTLDLLGSFLLPWVLDGPHNAWSVDFAVSAFSAWGAASVRGATAALAALGAVFERGVLGSASALGAAGGLGVPAVLWPLGGLAAICDVFILKDSRVVRILPVVVVILQPQVNVG